MSSIGSGKGKRWDPVVDVIPALAPISVMDLMHCVGRADLLCVCVPCLDYPPLGG